MQKRQLFFCLVIVFLCASIVSAAENDDTTISSTTATNTEITADSENPDAQLRGAGITPDSSFYFVEDSILSKFRSDLSNVEKKAAEIKEMIEQGKMDDARIALARYNEFADRLEKEIDPANQEEAKRIAAAIRNSVAEIESQIPDEDREEFSSIVETSDKIKTAAEIAGKIKELCETLSKLDPEQYSRTCKLEDDSPNWQKKLNKDLTDNQKKEAKAFIGIMTQCMKDAVNCKCQDISVKAFSNKCSEVAPLYAQCQKGDETKCAEADELSKGIEDSLPDYLRDALADLEKDFEGAQFDNHMPEECKKAGATTREACMRVMILESEETPEECRPALKEALDRGVKNEREFRKICEEIMFKENAPQECIDAGLTGESPKDGRKCQEIMKQFEGDRNGPEGEDRGPPQKGFNFDCRQIQNSEERLKCFDGAISNFKEGSEGKMFNEQEFRNIKDKERQCADSCSKQGGAWDFTGGKCSCRIDDRRFEDSQNRQQYSPEDQNQYRPPQGQYSPLDQEQQIGQLDQQQQQSQPDSTQQTQPSSSSSSTDSTSSSSSSGSTLDSSSSSSTDSSSSGSDSGGSSSSSGSSDSSSSSSSTTGSVILDFDNKFLKYTFG